MDMNLSECIERLELIEALKQLKYRYCAAVDLNYDADAARAGPPHKRQGGGGLPYRYTETDT
jgi:hypothetical protein